MKLYDGIKDALTIAQKADNIELYRMLLDLGAEALNLQNKVQSLTKENNELRYLLETEKIIIRHPEQYITLKDDGQEIPYCSACWDTMGKTVQLRWNQDGTFDCPHCRDHGVYDNIKNHKYEAEVIRTLSRGVKI